MLLMVVLGLASDLSAQVFDLVVAKDGSGDYATIQEAIDACPDKERKAIFVKAGTYAEKIMIGSHSKVSNKLLSIIGEDADKVIIAWDDYNGKTIVYDGRETKSGTPQSATFTVNAVDFYAENLTIQNTYTEKQAVALYNVGDRQTFKNCKLIGFQDTHYLKKGRRSYFFDCFIEGGTDYICAGGTAIFDNCTLNSVKNGSFITAPEDISAITTVGDKKYYYGFIFRDCTLTSDKGATVYLGRPWQGTSSSIYISCKMENIKPEGWSTWSGDNHKSSFFAEYGSMDANGGLLDVSKRVDWSYQLTKEELDTYYANDKIYSFVSGEYDPFSLVIAPEKPDNLSHQSDVMQWDAVTGAKGYIIYQNDVVLGFSTEAVFRGINTDDFYYTVRSVGANGNVSPISEAIGNITGIESGSIDKEKIYFRNGVLFIPENERFELYALNGILLKKTTSEREIDLSSFSKGVYLIKVINNNNVYSDKIYLR